MATSGEGSHDAIRLNIKDIFRRVDPQSDFNDDSDSNCILDSEDHMEASTDNAPDGKAGISTGRASSEEDLEEIVVNKLQAEDEAPIGMFYRWEVIKLCNEMGPSVVGYNMCQILAFPMEELFYLRFDGVYDANSNGIYEGPYKVTDRGCHNRR